MLIGIPKEIKNHEYRVGATPDMVKTLVAHGHDVIVETNAGTKIGFPDDAFTKAGAKIVSSAKEVYKAEMVIKVKEPQTSEFQLMHEGLILYCYLHLAPDPEQTKALVDAKVVAIAYETVEDRMKRLPLLVPMSEVAGRIATQAGATALQMSNGGRGVLLGGVPGVLPGKVVVIGGGVVGANAARMAMGLGADVTIMDNNHHRLRDLDALWGPRIKTLHSSPATVEYAVRDADLVVGAVLIPGAKAPNLVTRDMVKQMMPGSVIVDVAIDQGGCVETARPTTHSEPTYEEHGVIHYCVTNMPGACARSSTFALTNATLPYAIQIANKGWQMACKEDPGLALGLNVVHGKVTYAPVAHDLGYDYIPPNTLF